MKISQETITILKNFATINQSIMIRKGSTLSTMSNMKNIFASAIVREDFPIDFGIYDLNRFVGNLLQYDNPTLEWNDNFVLITDGSRTMKYMKSEESAIISPPEKGIKMPDPDVTIELTNKMVSFMNKMSALNDLPDYSLKTDDGQIYLVATDKKDPDSDEAREPLGVESDNDFNVFFKSENMKLIEGDYDVDISSKLISKFINKNKDIEYYIALESDSKFN